MKIFIFCKIDKFFILFLFLITSLSCSTIQPQSVKQKKVSPREGPCIEFSQLVYDFVIAGQKESIVHDFSFKNTGTDVLEIKGIETDCGCTVAEPSSRVFEPGAGGYVSATFETGRYNGLQEKKVLILTNDPQNPEIELKFRGKITREIGLQPEAIFFGEVSNVKKEERKVKVFQIGPEELRIISIDPSSVYFQIAQSRFEDKNSRGIVLSIFLDPNIPTGEIKEVITIQTNLKRRPFVDIPVYGEVLGDIRVSPKMVSLGKVKKGVMLPEKIRIFHIAKEEFTIKDISFDHPFLSYHLNPASNASEYSIGLKIEDNAPSGRLDTKIHIITDSSKEKALEILIYGIISN
jgi:hypothetical protein